LNTLIWLLSSLESGAANFSTSGIETLQLKVNRKRIEFNLVNKDFFTILFGKNGEKELSLLRQFTMLKRFAQKLKKEGFTLTISYKGSLLLILGSKAKPIFSQVLTGTDAIEIRNLYQLRQMCVSERIKQTSKC
jgi:hypothetical protein